MKKAIAIGVLLFGAAVTVFAATCTEGGKTLTGAVCTISDSGHCTCGG